MNPLRRALLAAMLAGATLPYGALHAQTQDAGKPARILLGFAAGGGFDAFTRVLAEALSQELNRPVIVENRVGAGSAVAAAALTRSPPDGTVMMVGPDSLVAINPLTTKNLSYNPDELIPVSTINEFGFAMVSGANPKMNSLQEYVEWAKKNPEKVSFGVSALGSPLHFFGLMLSQAADVPIQIVPFSGAAPVATALMGGHISAGMSNISSVVEQHRSGNMRVLAVTTPQRDPQLPDVPTFAEAGYPQITGTSFTALFAPPGTPQSIIDEWSTATQKVMQRPDVRERFEKMGLTPVGDTPADVVRRTKEAIELWRPIIAQSGYTAD